MTHRQSDIIYHLQSSLHGILLTAKINPLAHYTPNFECDKFRMILHMNRVRTTWPSQHAAVVSAANSGSTIIVHRSNILCWQKKLIERRKAVTWTHLNRALCGHFELWNEDTVIPPNVRIWLSNTAASFRRNEFSFTSPQRPQNLQHLKKNLSLQQKYFKMQQYSMVN
jgi:hypothetical protein